MFTCRACKGIQQSFASSVGSIRQYAAAANKPSNVNPGRQPHKSPKNKRSSGAYERTFQLATTRNNKKAETAEKQRQQQEEEAYRSDMQRQMGRPWRVGDVYAPHDLSSAEMQKWKWPQSIGRQRRDICDVLGVNPLHLYKNFSVMSEYVTEMGRIKGRSETGLRPINQRRMAKAIRRAVSCGLMPSVHRHPEILRPIIEGTAGSTGRRTPRN